MECAYYFKTLGGRHMECAYYFEILGGRHMECAYYFEILGGRHMECAYCFDFCRLSSDAITNMREWDKDRLKSDKTLVVSPPLHQYDVSRHCCFGHPTMLALG